MSRITAVARRELEVLFRSPIAWVAGTAFFLWNGLAYQDLVEGYVAISRGALAEGGTPATGVTGAVLEPLFLGLVVTILVFAPFLTMRSIAEERKTGSEEILLSLPLSEGQVVLGKFLAGLGGLAFLLGPTLIFPAALSRAVPLEWGAVVGGYLGLALVGSTAFSLGLWTSSWTENQIVAAVASLVLLMGLFFLEPLATIGSMPATGLPEMLSLHGAFERFSRGLLGTRDVAYHLAFTALFLYLTVQGLALRRRAG